MVVYTLWCSSTWIDYKNKLVFLFGADNPPSSINPIPAITCQLSSLPIAGCPLIFWSADSIQDIALTE